MKTNFLPVLYIRTPSQSKVLPPKNTHYWLKPWQACFRENASLGWDYPTLTCDIKVIPKFRKRRYWNTPCFTIHTAHPPMLWHSLQGHGTKHSICIWYNYALAKPASILVLSYKNTLCLFLIITKCGCSSLLPIHKTNEFIIFQLVSIYLN